MGRMVLGTHMRHVLRLITVLLGTGILLAGCEGLSLKQPIDQTQDTIFRPNRLLLRNLPQGQDSYSQGFRDGCETYLGIVGAGALRLLPEHVDGWRLTEDRVYARAFADGGTYCTFYLDWDIH